MHEKEFQRSLIQMLTAVALFSFSAGVVFMFLSLGFCAPVRAQSVDAEETTDDSRLIPKPGEFAWIDSIFALPEPTFAQMARPWALYTVTNGELHQKDEESYATRNECEAVAWELLSQGRIRSHLCALED